MDEPRKTWGVVRRIYFGVGILAAIPGIIFLFVPGWQNPFLLLVLPVLIISAAVFPDDELFNRIHRVVWRHEWPK